MQAFEQVLPPGETEANATFSDTKLTLSSGERQTIGLPELSKHKF